MTQCVLGIDVGTTAVKGILGTADGSIIAEASADNELISRYTGWAEEDARLWWDNVGRVCHALLEKQPDADILAVGVSSMVPTIVLLDKHDNPLRPSIQQNDARSHPQIPVFKQHTDEHDILQRTGSAITQQSIGPKLLWLWENEPDVMEKAVRLMGASDFINYKLTGTHGNEINWALESGLYDAQQEKWADDILALSRISQDLLGTVHLPHHIVGEITPAAAQHTGLKQGTPVATGGADHVSSAFSAGLKAPGDLIVKLGGAGDILMTLDQFAPDPRLFIDAHVIPGQYLINGCMAASGSILKWFRNQFAPGTDFAELDKAAEEISAGSEGLVMLPYFLGEKTPIFDPVARGVLFGLTLRHTRAHVFRAALEAVSFGFLHHLRVLAELGFTPNQRVAVTNGGAHSNLWRQITADVLGLELHLIGNHPGSSLGALFVAGMGVGVFDDWSQIDRFIQVETVTKPNARNHERYSKLFDVYRKVYETNKSLFPEIAEFDD